MIPALLPISIMPDQKLNTPSIVIHNVTASLDDVRKPFETSEIFPVNAPYNIPIKIINAHI